MKKFFILILVIFTTSSAFAKRIKRESLEIDYSTLSIETVLSLVPSKNIILNLLISPKISLALSLKKTLKEVL